MLNILYSVTYRMTLLFLRDILLIDIAPENIMIFVHLNTKVIAV